MASLAEHLASLNLSQYVARFSDQGVTDVSQLVALGDSELEAKLNTLGLLKGHAIKLKVSLDALKAPKKPQPQKPKEPQIAADSPLVKEAQKITAKLQEIEGLKLVLTKSKEMILGIDVAAYRKALDSIGTLQETMRQMDEVQRGEEEKMQEEETGDLTLLHGLLVLQQSHHFRVLRHH